MKISNNNNNSYIKAIFQDNFEYNFTIKQKYILHIKIICKSSLQKLHKSNIPV